VTTLTAPFPLVGNLIGLPHGAAKGLGVAGGTSYIDDICSQIAVGTGPRVNPLGSILLYVVTAEEAGKFIDAIRPDSPTDQSVLIGAATQANLVQRIGGPATPLLPNTRYSFNGFSINAFLQYRPSLWSPLVLNLSGWALSVTIAPYAVHTLQS
jgi:hypothetical protein